jgi:hypothetical protein
MFQVATFSSLHLFSTIPTLVVIVNVRLFLLFGCFLVIEDIPLYEITVFCRVNLISFFQALYIPLNRTITIFVD